MKRKIFTICLTAMFALVAYGQQPSGTIMKASVAPVIDGVVDEVWAEANVYDIDKPFQTEVPTLGEPGETNWRALWTDDGMYILLIVTDDAFYPHYSVDPPGNNWEYDKPEIYFDVNYVLQDGIGPGTAGSGHYQVAPGFTDGQNDGTAITQDNGVVYAFMVTEPNYIGEYFVPFSLLKDKEGIGLDKTGNIGFDVTIIDRESGDAGRRRAVWANIGTINESWSNMDEAGIIIFDGAEAGTYIESITLTGGTITEDNGTLQIVAEILPEDASNKVLLWSVENTTGRATIDSDGVLTGVADGEVIVTASSTDGSYEEASVTVTITGQVTTLWEMNVIKNGTFDLVETDGTATFWGGWGGDAGSALPQIVDGVAECTPVAAADVWQYQFSQQGLTALPNVDYIFAMKAWSDADRNIVVDFEDTPANNYTRYGTSTDPESNGSSEWNFPITTEPTWYVFNVNFDKMVETTVQKVQYMLSTTGDKVYLDSILLVTTEEYNTVSVPLQNAASKIKLYPNPMDGSNVLTVVLPSNNSKVTIFDSVGRKMEEVIETSDKAVFNVSRYARGVYFVRVNNEPALKFIK